MHKERKVRHSRWEQPGIAAKADKVSLMSAWGGRGSICFLTRRAPTKKAAEINLRGRVCWGKPLSARSASRLSRNRVTIRHGYFSTLA